MHPSTSGSGVAFGTGAGCGPRPRHGAAGAAGREPQGIERAPVSGGGGAHFRGVAAGAAAGSYPDMEGVYR